MNKALSIHALLMFLLALGLAVWSFFVLGKSAPTSVPEWEKTGQMALDVRFKAEEQSVLRRNGRDAVLLPPGAEAELVWDEEKEALLVNLYAGTVLMGTQAGDFTASVRTDFAQVDSSYGMAWVSLAEDAAFLDVYALRGSSDLSFVYDGEILNTLPVPAGMRIKVPESKLAPNLARLRLTKLAKEFPAFPLTDKDKTEALELALEDFSTAYQLSAERTLQALQVQADFGPPLSGFGAQVSGFLSRFEAFATLLPHAQQRLDAATREESLSYAVSNFLYGKDEVGAQWLGTWQKDVPSLADLKPLYTSLFFVLPGDDLYPIKWALMQVFMQEEALDVLQRQFQEVQELLGRGEFSQAKKAYDVYAQSLAAALDAGVFDSEGGASELGRNYIVLERLLREEAIFYTADSFSLLYTLEDKLLQLVDSDQDLDEERQAFIQSKLRFLERLFQLVVGGQVPVDKAGLLAEDLIESAEADLAALSGDAAVGTYFKDQLQEFSVALQFMSSPEFFTYTSFDEGLAEYQEKLNDLKDLNAYLQSIRSESDVPLSPLALQEAVIAVGTLLTSNGIQYQDVISLEDAEYRLFKVDGARVNGIAFEGKFDLQTQIFYDVELEDIRFSTGLRLDDLGSVLQRAQNQELPNEEENPQDVLGEETGEELSVTESVALQYAKDGFVEAGLNPNDFSLELEDLNENLFRFSGVLGEQKIPVEGLYSADTSKVSSLKMEVQGSFKALPGMDLSQMESAVLATYEALSATKSVN